MKRINYLLALLLISLFSTLSSYSQDIGATFCWHFEEIYGGHAHSYNQSIVTENLPTTAVSPKARWEGMDQWWENMVEEVDYAGLDYVALLSRGTQPNQTKDLGAGDPKHIKTMVKYMQDRAAKFKLAIFDDCPNSWTASRNYNLYGKDSSQYELFDCGNADNYKYIWDYNLKLAFENIPDNMRYKIDNRPVIIFWSVKDTWMSNMEGNLSKIIAHIKQKCQADFGFLPYLIVMSPWFDRDSSLTPAMVDAAHGWFSSAGGTSFSLTNLNNFKAGVCVPSFVKPVEQPNGSLYPYMNVKDQGDRLRYGLDNTVKAGANLTLVEGFTDAAEGAALWRSNEEGTKQYYDYPNQRLNILRSYTKNPYPFSLKMETEACDFNNDLTAGNSGNSFSYSSATFNRNLDILKCSDTGGGWFVTNTEATEWMEWRELPLVPENKFEIRYKSTAAASIFISIDGVAQPTVILPATNSAWTTIDAGTFINGANSARTVRLTIASGSPDINYFTRTNLNTGPVNVSSVAVTPAAASVVKTKTLQLVAAVSPSYATNTKLTWSSSNTSIATVDAFGLVTGLALGTATITVTTEDGAKTATAEISVVNPSTQITLQAEDALLSGATIAANNAGYNGTGFADFNGAAGDYIKWTVAVPAAGNYDLTFRYAVASGNRPLNLSVNGTVVVVAMPFPGTGAWNIWKTVSSTQALKAGVNEIQLTVGTGNGGNIDELVVTNVSNLGTNDIEAYQKEKSVAVYPNPYKGGDLSVELTGFNTQNEVKIKILNLIGQEVYHTSISQSNRADINLSGKLNEAIYFVSIESGNTQIVKKLIVK
ncbi:DUF5010 domain-containing protein [Flavobacterium nackdongense]|uniref:DUF5010 domain-containing protein n=1 Tax=Flavobacterium nackdongense TaxID=2547394 RepID=A0A4P6YB13_9FLAO|nr:DUF5010 domain-containing protein [Flavobacterium nackdongense]QBN17845.1 DUF5010 domain-containing protein [Flavobacterium nackdongense]